MPTMFDRFLAPTAPSKRRTDRPSRPRDELDDFLSSDLEHSFASTSLEDPLALTPESEKSDAMDISPAPLRRTVPPPKESAKIVTRPRALTSGPRLFGTDRSNVISPNPSSLSSKTGSTSGKRTQRSALPMEWINPSRNENIFSPVQVQQPSSPGGDAMDVDTSLSLEASPPAVSFLRGPQSAAPGATFNNLFFDSLSPRRSFESPLAERQPKKRRSASPDLGRSPSINDNAPSSPDLLSSPSDRKLGSAAPLFARPPSKPSLQGLGKPANNLKRPRRPALSAMVQPSDGFGTQSAYPALGSDDSGEGLPKNALPTRRAMSALVQKVPFADQSFDDSFEETDRSSPAQDYAKRHNIKTIRRCDGTEDFRPITGASAMTLTESPSAKFMRGGIPGFGDNEAFGKILPCHRVKEDGLMRITPDTLNALLDGKYNDKIHQHQVVDCRFDYEFAGGHIPGAINVNNVDALKEVFLNSSLCPEKPSLSGDSLKQTILVFHCEFSAKRAPTFAKTLRQVDRTENNHVYPRIFFPEVYVLEGGYCGYFKSSSARCDPPGYVTMNDPNHAKSCEADLSQFRKTKFARHRSYAYGEGASGRQAMLSHGQQQKDQQKLAKRNTAPSGGPSMPVFASANIARSRRSGSGAGLTTLPEDAGDTDTDDDQQLGDSPCPPPTKAPHRRILSRAQTYDPRRL